ncbi:MAG: response regulator, partial [Anaerolineae bacterium]|nr:response regulator [Anaerolineae bacterium]
EAEQARHLLHGDDLQLGSMHLHVSVIAAPEHGSVVHRQPGIVIKDDSAAGKGQRILIVEDDAPTAELFQIVLERAGFTTQICREVVSAIRALNTEPPAAIVLDLMLPGIHGLELCRYVRRDIEQSDIPIVIVSGAVSQANIARAMEVGADVFLGKPVGAKLIVQTLSSLMAQREAHKPTSLQTKQLDGSAPLRAMPEKLRRNALVIFVEGHHEPIAVVVPHRITIGRRGGSGVAGSQRPHIDLDRYGAFDAGVSRVHAAIVRDGEAFYLEDLGSSNGTYLNDELLPAHDRRLLENAADVRLGYLHLHVYFFTKDDEQILSPEEQGDLVVQVDESTRPDPPSHSNGA